MTESSAFSEVLSELCHEISTPLSVIVNDLTYFKSLLPQGECDRAIRRAHEIKEILTRYTTSHSVALKDSV